MLSPCFKISRSEVHHVPRSTIPKVPANHVLDWLLCLNLIHVMLDVTVPISPVPSKGRPRAPNTSGPCRRPLSAFTARLDGSRLNKGHSSALPRRLEHPPPSRHLSDHIPTSPSLAFVHVTMSFHAGAHPMSSSVFYDNPNISRSASVSVKPKPQAIRAKSQTSVPSRVVSPPENRRDSFDFSVPSLPPRLANFGRKISQMRDDFIDSLDDAPETKHKSLDSTRESLKQLSAVEHSHSDVPGMGDEPVMCPFCNKPLPPVLFHQPSPKKPSRPGMRRPATSVGVTAPFGKSSTAPTTRNNSVTLDSPPVKPLSSLSSSSSSSGKLMDPAEVKPRPKPLKDVTKAGLASEIMRSPDPAVTSESLRPQVMDADKLNHAAAEINVSEDDLRRWSSLAGVPLPPIERPSSAPPSTTTDLSSPVPHLGKPPPDQGSSPGGRFGFFRKTSAKPKLPKSEDDSDDDDTGTGSGYSKLLGAGSDDEDATIHAEPKGMTDDEGPDKDTVEDKDKDEEGITIEANGVPIAAPVAQVPEVEPPKVDNEELRKVLQEVLVKISEIVRASL